MTRTQKRDLLRVLIKDAAMVQYDHGGARVAVTAPGKPRELIADFYGNGEWREYFLGLINAEHARRVNNDAGGGLVWACPRYESAAPHARVSV